MRRLGFLVALVAIGLVAQDAPPARAQMGGMADAIGKPLPRADLPKGTMTVRVVAGEMSAPVTEHDVRLTVDGKTRTARTDASGRATFPDLAGGATVQAATDGASGEVTSEEFPLPEDGGVSVLLSTVPWKDNGGGMSGGGMGGGGGGMPQPRALSGEPRPEQADPGGRVTVRLSYDDLASAEGLADHPVVVVKYASDGTVAARVVQTDAAGHAMFDNLDTTGNSAYYAMTLLPRDGHTDRLMTAPMMPLGEMGERVILSGEKLKSGKPVVDDLTKYSREPDLPPGQVMVIFGGRTPQQGTVQLHDCATGKVVGEGAIEPGKPIPSTVTGTVGDATPSDKAPAGTAQVRVVVAASGQELGLPQAVVHVRPVGGAAPAPVAPAPVAPGSPTPPAEQPAPAEHTGSTDADGNLTLAGLPVGVPLEAVVDVQGKSFTGKPFTLAADKGVTIAITTSFELLSVAEADLSGIPATPEGAYYAEVVVKGTPYRSPPFQMAPERGTVIPIFVIDPRVEFSFSLDAFLDDDYLAVRGQFTLQNGSFAPWSGPSEGLRIAMPSGATGLVVADESKTFAAVDGSSFRLLRPIPPMGADFRGAFSIPAGSGSVTWDMPLPLGASQASLAVRMIPTMRVDAPKGADARPIKDPDSGFTWYAIQNIQIPPNQRMVFTIAGLPARPAWQRWARLGVGLAVILLLAFGVVFAAAQRAQPPTEEAAGRKARRRRIEDLLDQVADHDRAAARGGAAQPARREQLVAQLEQLYREDDRGA